MSFAGFSQSHASPTNLENTVNIPHNPYKPIEKCQQKKATTKKEKKIEEKKIQTSDTFIPRLAKTALFRCLFCLGKINKATYCCSGFCLALNMLICRTQ